MKDDICFIDDLSAYDFPTNLGRVVHLLCLEGSMSFLLNHVRYNIAPGDFVILVNGAIASDIMQSDTFKAVVLVFMESFYQTDNVRNTYNIVGHMSLLGNPVMRLDGGELEVIRESMEVIRKRLPATDHLFHRELMAALLKAHVLELLDFHARKYRHVPPDSRPAIIMADFIRLLEKGKYISHRNLAYYADRLNITPHYLSDVSKMLSGQPATYWIDKFTIQEVLRQMSKPGMTLSEISYRLDFSSLSHLSRFVKKRIGRSPSDLLKTLGDSIE